VHHSGALRLGIDGWMALKRIGMLLPHVHQAKIPWDRRARLTRGGELTVRMARGQLYSVVATAQGSAGLLIKVKAQRSPMMTLRKLTSLGEAEAGDCRGIIGAGRVGLNRQAAERLHG
jgi:hypothetical protein